MSRYIDADELKKQLMIESSLGHIMTLEDVEKIVDFIKTASVREVKRGKWEQMNYFDEDENVYTCSQCGEDWTLNAGNPKENNMNFCLNCGADMRGEEDDKL